MARNERGFEGAHLKGVTIDASGVLVPEDTTNEVPAGNLEEVISALAARIKTLEDAAA